MSSWSVFLGGVLLGGLLGVFVMAIVSIAKMADEEMEEETHL